MSTHTSIARIFFLVLFALTACRTPQVSGTELAGCHPACPGAQQASVGDAGAALRGAAPAATASADARAPSTLAYLCPMHLYVGSDQPGRCPECGMTLVPRAQALEHVHDR